MTTFEQLAYTSDDRGRRPEPKWRGGHYGLPVGCSRIMRRLGSDTSCHARQGTPLACIYKAEQDVLANAAARATTPGPCMYRCASAKRLVEPQCAHFPSAAVTSITNILLNSPSAALPAR